MPRDRLSDIFLRFDFADPASQGPLIFSRPLAVLEAHELDEIPALFKRLDGERQRGRYAAGFVSYEAAPAFDRALETHDRVPGLPLVWFGIFESADADHDTIDVNTAAPIEPVTWTPDLDERTYSKNVAAIREAILRGDVYQVNHTFRLEASVDPGSLPVLYRRLREAHQPPYAALLSTGRWHILSLSPELFLRIDGTHIVSRPMKGTTGRGRWPDEDREQAARLAGSGKDRSENVMIVDLVRNDLGRISTVGSVQVPALFDLERYPALWQMTSTVVGRLQPGTSSFDVLAALFPAGSITGAPKSSAMRAIHALEASPRGVYTGAIGYFAPDAARFNVAIRTALVDAHTGRMTAGIGGGVTWESTAENEHAEALAKAAFLSVPPDIELIETMRLTRTGITRLERHLQRLADSAAFLDFHCDLEAVRAHLDEVLRAHADGGLYRVRLLSGRSGVSRVEVTPFAPAPPHPHVALARTPVSSRDKTLFHKTTNRRTYEQARLEQPDVFDVLLWNEREEVTEFTIGNVVVEIDGVRCTPPRSSGLLAGVFRAELVDEGIVTERVIAVNELAEARRVWLVNSLREWVEVRLTMPAPIQAGGIFRT